MKASLRTFGRRAGLGLFSFLTLTTFIFGQSNESDTSDLFSESISESASADTTAAALADSGFVLELYGNHELDLNVPVYSDALTLDGVKVPSLANLLGFKLTSGDVKIVSEWNLDLSPSYSADDQLTGTPTLALSAGENAIYWNPGSFKFGFGWQYFSWGSADKENPTDNLNPRDYTAGPDADKIPVLSASATWYPTDFMSVQGVYVPVYQSSTFSVDFASELPDALFYGIDVSYPSNSTIYNLYASNVGVSNPSDELSSFTAGGRVAFNFSSVDFSLSYLYDWDKYYTPVIAVEADPINVVAGSTTVGNAGNYYRVSSISLEKKRIHRIGADVKTTLDKVGLWAEGCLSITDGWTEGDWSLRNPTLAWTAGGDVSFGPNDSFYVNLQYLGQYVYDYDSSFYDDYADGKPASASVGNEAYMTEFYQRAMVQKLGLQTEGLLQGASVNLKFPLADSAVTPQVTAVYLMPFYYDDTHETRYGSLVLKPEVDLMPVDSFHLTLGANLYWAWHSVDGGEVTLNTDSDRIGIFTENNSIYLAVKYSWNYQLKK